MQLEFMVLCGEEVLHTPLLLLEPGTCRGLDQLAHVAHITCLQMHAYGMRLHAADNWAAQKDLRGSPASVFDAPHCKLRQAKYTPADCFLCIVFGI